MPTPRPDGNEDKEVTPPANEEGNKDVPPEQAAPPPDAEDNMGVPPGPSHPPPANENVDRVSEKRRRRSSDISGGGSQAGHMGEES